MGSQDLNFLKNQLSQMGQIQANQHENSQNLLVKSLKESTNYLDNHLKEIEKEYGDLHESNLNKLNERLNRDATEQKETLFEILSSVTDIRMSLEKGQVSSVEKDVKFEDTVKKIDESVEKIKR